MARRDGETSVTVTAFKEQVQRPSSGGKHSPGGSARTRQGALHAPSQADLEAEDAVQQRHEVVADRATAAVVVQGHDNDDAVDDNNVDDNCWVPSGAGGAKSGTLCLQAESPAPDRADNLSATTGKREKISYLE